MNKRSGLTIVEVIVSITILVAIIVPVADTFSTFRSGFKKINRYNVAIGLASSVLDHIYCKMYNSDIRLTASMASDTEKMAAAATGEVAQEFFDSFIETGSRVTSEGSTPISSYFVRINELTKNGVFGITKENDPDLHRQLKDYACSVDVFYSLPYDVLDSDVDGIPEVDMAEIKVTISWDDDGRNRAIELWTVYSARQYNDAQ